jgi:hypothetical protein
VTGSTIVCGLNLYKKWPLCPLYGGNGKLDLLDLFSLVRGIRIDADQFRTGATGIFLPKPVA